MRIVNVSTGLYRNPAYLPVEKAAIPDMWLIQKYGDVVYSDTGKPGWYATNPKIGYASLNTAVVVTADIEKDSMIATIVSNGTGAYWALPPGMNIKIVGAGAEGADLNARILKNDGTNLTLDTAASTTVSGAELKFQPLTISA